MKINWDRWIRRDRGTLLFCGYSLLFCAMVLLYLDFSKVKVKGKEDLVFINGPFQSYSWIEFRRGSELTLKLQNFNARFQIKADFYRILKKEKLENITAGQNIIVAIPKGDEYNLTSGRKLLAFSVVTDEGDILNLNDAIKKHNDYTLETGSAIAVILGLTFIYFGYKSKLKSAV